MFYYDLIHFDRPIVIEYGMWDQIRVDQGREFYLMLFVQDQWKMHRRNTDRLPFMQTTSKEVSKLA